MNLKEARFLVQERHVAEAASLVEAKGEGGLQWLYDQTGRRQPQHRYVVVGGRRYPTKAFGFLVAQLAGNIQSKENELNVNEAYAPLKKLGYIEVSGPENRLDEGQRAARAESYYLQLARPAQAKFRIAVCAAYAGKCALSGTGVLSALEAAHVEPFRSGGVDHISNGVLLRADLHRLFDFGHLAFELVGSRLIARFSQSCGDDYRDLAGGTLVVPLDGPEPSAFARTWSDFNQISPNAKTPAL